MAELMTQSDGDVTVIFFKNAAILDEKNIDKLGEELFEIAAKGHKPKLLVNFEKVEYLSSAVLGKLVALHKRMKAEKGILKLCNLAANILEVFKITKLDKLFEIYNDHEKAIKSFQKGGLFGRFGK